jgi:hypothetical protein
MATRVRLEMTLAELHETIAQSIRDVLAESGHRIVTAAGEPDNGSKVRELGRNAAGCLMAFQVDEESDEDKEAA